MVPYKCYASLILKAKLIWPNMILREKTHFLKTTLSACVKYLNVLDINKKIQFSMQIEGSEGLELLDLILTIDSKNKVRTNVFAKSTNCFTYVLPSTSYNTKNINKVPRGLTLRLRACMIVMKCLFFAPHKTKFLTST